MMLPKARHATVFHNERIGVRRWFRHWIALTTAHAGKLRAVGGARRVSVVPNAISPSVATGCVSNVGASGVLRLGAIGEISHRKGFDVLLEALADLVARGRDVHLTIAGSGCAQASLEHLAHVRSVSGRIEFMGWIKDPCLLFNRIDLLCVPSRAEPFGMVVIEAMAAGIPVIATLTDGPSEIIDDGRTGWLFPVDDVAALAERLDALHEDQSLLQKVSVAARNAVHERYGFIAIGKQIIRVMTDNDSEVF